MALGVARVGDLISHGGEIITGSENVRTNSRRTARLNDQVRCNIHGLQRIVSASGTVRANTRGVARINDRISCGAFITTGSSNTRAGG